MSPERASLRQGLGHIQKVVCGIASFLTIDPAPIVLFTPSMLLKWTDLVWMEVDSTMLSPTTSHVPKVRFMRRL